MWKSRFIFSDSAFRVGEVHASEDKDGADEEVDGNLLMEQPPSKKNGGDRIKIDIICGYDST